MAEAKRYKLSEIIANDTKKRPAIEIETADGQVFTIPPPIQWADEVFQLAQTEQFVECAKALLGEKYAAFTKAGGTAVMFAVVIGEYMKSQGMSLGESKASTSS